MSTLSILEKAFPGRVISSKERLAQFSRDESPYLGSVPFAAVKPRNTADVSKLMKLCFKNNIKVTVRGAGSALSGSSVPDGRSIVLDMSGFDKILETHIEDRYVVVEPGVVIDALNKHLSKYDYFYPPDPGSSSFATIGGTISTNAGGLRAVSYGTTKEWILGLELVLPDGKIIRTGERTLKRSIGYDLTGLIVASEGTLGVVTKAILKIWPKPESTGMVVSYFANITDAGNAVAKLKKSGITPLAVEFIDRESMNIMHESGGVRFPNNANYTIFVELGSPKESMSRFVDQTRKIMIKCGALDSEVARTKQKMDKLYASRKYIFTAMKKMADKSGQNLTIADVIVPSSELIYALPKMQSAARKSGLEVVLFGHIGDGNIHANILYRVKQGKRVEKLEESLGRIAIKHNGSVSGEHGIGMLKKKLLKEEFRYRDTEENLALMKRIKFAFDPKGILNKGKIFD